MTGSLLGRKAPEAVNWRRGCLFQLSLWHEDLDPSAAYTAPPFERPSKRCCWWSPLHRWVDDGFLAPSLVLQEAYSHVWLKLIL